MVRGSRSALLAWLLLLPATPLHAANLITVNNSDGQGVWGGQFATPPGSCTAVPNGATGGCSRRAQAAVEDWAAGQYGSGSQWSDLQEAALPPGAVSAWTGLPVPTIQSRIGNSWIPDSCNRPWCGHMLKGDVEFFDENLDGTFDDTWIDFNLNGIRENGEVDRVRAEQFAWGITAAVQDLSDLSLGIPGNVSPPGLARMSVRQALGDAALADNCTGLLADPECVNGVVSRVDIAVPSGQDPKVWGMCDPDRFTPLLSATPDGLVRAQRALDNCLWFFTSTPRTAIGSTSPTNPDPLLDAHAVRSTWLNEHMVKYTASFTPDRQDFAQNWFVTYGFDTEIPDISKSIYQNEWRFIQSDRDPNPGLPSPSLDTYAYSFIFQHKARGRARGHDQDHNLLTADCATYLPLPIPRPLPLPPAECTDGETNPTVDPFWGEALLRDIYDLDLDLNTDEILLDAYNVPRLDYTKLGDDFEFRTGEDCGATCLKSGVGKEIDFTFLFEQVVEGYLLSCLDCGHPAPSGFGPVTYSFDWPELVPIEGVPHPPPTTLIIPVANGTP